MIRGYLVYEEADAKKNKSFILMLQEEAERHGISLQLYYPGDSLTEKDVPDFVWNRSRQPAVAKYYEQLGIRVFNNSETNALANNKKLATDFVASLNIRTIPTWTCYEQIERYPVVVKTINGHGGQEVVLCNNVETLQQAFSSFAKAQIIIQPFIESNAQDVRVWMLGTTILGAVLRTGANNFKSNYTLGGSILKFDLPTEIIDAVTTIATTLRSDYIGIDFIKGKDGHFYFNEIEDPVGARSYYELFGNNLTKKLLHYIQSQLLRGVTI